MRTIEKSDSPNSTKAISKKNFLSLKKIIVFGFIVIAGFIGIYAYINRPIIDPFNQKTLISVQFPLYYPTNLPPGYSIKKGSVNIPSEGVVVFSMINHKGDEIFMSEETRPSRFNFGGYYMNFNNLQERVIGEGTIAVGNINNNQTTIGSLATAKTWIIANTQASVTLNQLIDMLSSLVVSH